MGMSPPIQGTEKVMSRKSILLQGASRRASCVTFGENCVIEIEKCKEIIEKEYNEYDDKLGKIENTQKDDDDVPMPNMRRWTDSLKIRRKKNKVKDIEPDDLASKNKNVNIIENATEKTI